MDVLDAIFSRTTTHKYAPEPVDEAIIDDALRAAHQAPCHKVTWPWRFTRVGPETRARIADIGLAIKAEGKTLGAEQVGAIRGKLLNPAVLVVVSQVRCDDAFRAREDYAAVACAIQNFQLVVTARGLGAKWSTGGVTTHPDTYAALGIDPEAEEVVGFVWAGVPAQDCEVKRPPLDSVVRTVP